MKRMPVSEARKIFSDLVNQAFYAGETTIVTRRGKGDVAAIVPVKTLEGDDFALSPKTARRKPAQPTPPASRGIPIKLLS